MYKGITQCAHVFVDETKPEEGVEEGEQTTDEHEQNDSIPELSRKFDMACTGPSTSPWHPCERSFDSRFDSPNFWMCCRRRSHVDIVSELSDYLLPLDVRGS